MLSNPIAETNRIYAICENSGDILPGDAFHGLFLAERDDRLPSGLTRSRMICCGTIRDDELLFRTEDGRCYFSIRGGWGSRNGELYGLRVGLFHDFRHPTTAETVPAEAAATLEAYLARSRSFHNAMAYYAKKRTLDAILSVMKNAKKE
ncbi:MAG: hypothetical protein J1E00_02785 [Oscillospiraceae bacterium]|nr:hypothetical protein [Oscillospiraceae bacterium]